MHTVIGKWQLGLHASFDWEKTVTSNTRISNVEKFNLEIISNLVGLGVGCVWRVRVGWDSWVCVLGVCVGVCVEGGGHDYRGCYVTGDSRLNFSRSSFLMLPATLV